MKRNDPRMSNLPRYLKEKIALNELTTKQKKYVAKGETHSNAVLSLEKVKQEIETENQKYWQAIDIDQEVDTITHEYYQNKKNFSYQPPVQMNWLPALVSAAIVVIAGLIFFGLFYINQNKTLDEVTVTHVVDALSSADQNGWRGDLTRSEQLNLLGTFYAQRDNWKLAEQLFETAVEMNQGYFPAAFNLAHLCIKKGNYNKAEKFLALCQKLRPNNINVYLALAHFYEQADRMERF